MNDIEQGANKRYNHYFASRWEKLLLDSKLIDGAVLNDFGHVSISTISAQFLPAWRCHGQWLDSIHLFMIKINGLVV